MEIKGSTWMVVHGHLCEAFVLLLCVAFKFFPSDSCVFCGFQECWGQICLTTPPHGPTMGRKKALFLLSGPT